jgi:hypothetical protein
MEEWAIRIQTLEHDYKTITLSRQWKEQALAANSQKPTSERRPLFIIVFL